MTLSQPKAILRLYNEILKNGLTLKENEKISKIIESCEKDGKYIFNTESGSYWSFVKSTKNNEPCIRMIFAVKENNGGKVQNIDRIISLIKNVENTLLFIDFIEIVKDDKVIFLDIVKIIR